MRLDINSKLRQGRGSVMGLGLRDALCHPNKRELGVQLVCPAKIGESVIHLAELAKQNATREEEFCSLRHLLQANVHNIDSHLHRRVLISKINKIQIGALLLRMQQNRPPQQVERFLCFSLSLGDLRAEREIVFDRRGQRQRLFQRRPRLFSVPRAKFREREVVVHRFIVRQ